MTGQVFRARASKIYIMSGSSGSKSPGMTVCFFNKHLDDAGGTQVPHRKESLMRILALTILAVGMASAAPSARAQTYDPNYPVCLQIYQSWKDYYFECAYTSLAQCNMSASGRAAQCIINPYYAGPKTRSRRY